MKAPSANDAVTTAFKRHFGYTPSHVVQAPGRLELLGAPAECVEGIVLSVAVDKYVSIASAPRTDGRIELVTSAIPGRELFWMSEIRRNAETPWADPVKGVLDQLRKRRVHFSGFNAAVHSGIPTGADMGGSAAFEVAAALTLRRLYPFSLTDTGATIPPKRNERGVLPPLTPAERMHYARLCSAAEREFLGTPNSIIDPLSSLFGKAWNVINSDCRFLTVEHAPLIGEILIVCDLGTGTAPDSNTSENRRRECDSAAQKLRAKSLRSVEMKHLQTYKSWLTPREYECAYHVVGELQRVVFAERALREDDHRQFGQYLFQSHESARDFLKNSCPELDLLVELARTHRGCLGARRIGGDDRGATLNLVAYHQAEDFMETIANQFQERTGDKLESFVCQIVDGAA